MIMVSYKLSVEQKARKLQWQRESRAKDRERYRAYDRAHYNRIKDSPGFKVKNLAKSTAWRLNNPERFLEQMRAWTAKNPSARWAVNKRWGDAHPMKRRLYLHVRRARMHSSVIGIIILEKIHNWDSNICGICDEFITGKFELDHIKPISKGGAHATENLQKAHPHCNRVKSAKLL